MHYSIHSEEIMATIVTKNGDKYEGVLDLNSLLCIESGQKQFTPKFIFERKGFRYIEEHVRKEPNDAVATYNYILSKIRNVPAKYINLHKEQLKVYNGYLHLLGVKFDPFNKRAEALPTLSHENLDEFIRNLSS
jgi:hypothetical protein